MLGIGNFNSFYNKQEIRTFKLHLAYSLLEGVVLGVLALNEFVFIKSLHGTNYQLGLLFQFSMVVFIFLIFINEFIKRTTNKRKMLRITGFLTRLPLVFLLFFPRSVEELTGSSIYHYIFLTIFLIYYFGNTIIYPMINLFLKSQYDHKNFGKLYGYATSANKIIMLLATFVYGLLLDFDNYAFTYVFPVVALIGIASVYLLTSIHFTEKIVPGIKQGFLHSIKESALNMLNILKNNRPYKHFEIGFMFYGFSFMITVTVITIFFERALHLSYSSVAFYKNAYNIIAIILLPYTGKLLGKIDPRKFAAITFASLMMYVFFVMLTEYIPVKYVLAGIEIYPTLVIAFIFYGIFAATMALLWFIGSAYFCKPEEAGDYQSVHLSLTAIRAMFAPLLGVLFYEIIGFAGTFALSILAIIAGIGLMFWSYRKESSKNELVS